jgi:hypothetical protein
MGHMLQGIAQAQVKIAAAFTHAPQGQAQAEMAPAAHMRQASIIALTTKPLSSARKVEYVISIVTRM